MVNNKNVPVNCFEYNDVLAVKDDSRRTSDAAVFRVTGVMQENIYPMGKPETRRQ